VVSVTKLRLSGLDGNNFFSKIFIEKLAARVPVAAQTVCR